MAERPAVLQDWIKSKPANDFKPVTLGHAIVAGGPITETGEPRLPSPVHEYQGSELRI